MCRGRSRPGASRLRHTSPGHSQKPLRAALSGASGCSSGASGCSSGAAGPTGMSRASGWAQTGQKVRFCRIKAGFLPNILCHAVSLPVFDGRRRLFLVTARRRVHPEYSMFNRGGKPMRLFFAIELRRRGQRGDQPRRLAPAPGYAGGADRQANGRRPVFNHLTVQFLGEYPASLLPDLQEVLAGAAVGVPPFPLCFESWGRFRAQPRDPLAGRRGAAGSDAAGADRSPVSCGGGRCPLRTRPYQPHLTIGRQLEPDPLWLGRQPQPAVSMQVERVSLMESVRVGGRLVYRPLFRQPLQKGP